MLPERDLNVSRSVSNDHSKQALGLLSPVTPYSGPEAIEFAPGFDTALDTDRIPAGQALEHVVVLVSFANRRASV